MEAGAAFVGGAVSPERRIEIADVLFRASLWVKEDNPDALSNLATLAMQKGEHQKAHGFAVRSVALSPSSWGSWFVLGQALNGLGKFLDSRMCIQRALELNPKEAPLWFVLAGLWEIAGDYQKSEECYKEAFGLNPSDLQIKFCWGMIKMLRGDFAFGLPMYEARLEHFTPKFPTHKTAEIAQDIRAGKVTSLIIEAEQGVGDLFQMARYAPLLRSKTCLVTLHCDDSLVSIMQRFAGFDNVVGYSEPWTPLKYPTVTAMSLPYLMQLLGEDIYQPPATVHRLGHTVDGQFRIGYCYKGNPAHANDRFRSIPESLFLPLRMKINEKCAESFDLTVKKGWEPSLSDIIDCDLVITVDTAVAHLAGSLMVPVWMLSSAVGDWRWGLNIESTKWYPSMTILRQEKPLEWAETINRVIKKLEAEYK